MEGTPNRRGLISLRSCYGYVAAEANGKIRANREQIGAWEVFQVAPGVLATPAITLLLQQRSRLPLSPNTYIFLFYFKHKLIIIFWCIKFNHQKYGFCLETNWLILQSTVFQHHCFTWWPSSLLKDVRWRLTEIMTICEKSEHGAITPQMSSDIGSAKELQ